MTAALLVLVAGLPTLMACAALAPGLRAPVRRLAWLAAAPGLAAALLVPPGGEAVFAEVLLGLRLGLGDEARRLLLAASLVWLLAAVHMAAFFEERPRTTRFTGLFLLSMAGNLGVFVAEDAAGFYMAFGVMSLAAYVLVVHDETPRAYAAGRIYIWLAMLGEACLLMGMLLGAALADDMAIAEIRKALAQHGGTPAVALLIAGFGIKLGLVPLHLWLPSTYAATPPPGAAALAGAMINAGVFGLLAFLPLGAAVLEGPGLVLALAGGVTAFYGVAVGLLQRDARAVLAYSSLSQMGVLAGGLGVAALLPEAAPAIVAAVALYAVHHGLAKGGLFLAVGARRRGADAGALRPVSLLVVGLAALTLGGLPFTSGAVAKHALKAALDVDNALWLDVLGWTLSLSAAATTALVVHFLRAFLSVAPSEPTRPGRAGVLLGAMVVAVALGQAVTWAMASAETAATVLSAKGVVDALWPFVLGVGAALALGRLRLPAVPAGDLLVPLQRGLAALRTRAPASIRLGAGVPARPRLRVEALLARARSGDLQTITAAAVALTVLATMLSLAS